MPSMSRAPVMVRDAWLRRMCQHPIYSKKYHLEAHLRGRATKLRYENTHLDTIFALSTHPGKAGIAVIRVSGPQAKSKHDTGYITNAKTEACFNKETNVPANKRIVRQGDSDLVPRAFENDKLDLTEVEGLADLLNAETEAQRRLALRQADGGLRNLYDSWRTQLIQSMALIEALIDFGEDENIEDDVYDNAKRQAAIVSPIPGTTRDVVEVSLDIGGYPILIGDTAGLRSSKDEIEMEGVRRAQDRISLADINIAILPVTEFLGTSRVLSDNDYTSSGSSQGVDPIVLEAIRRNPKTMVLINKMDLSRSDTDNIMSKIRSQLWPEADHGQSNGPEYMKGRGKEDLSNSNKHRLWAISCQTGDGIAMFLQDFINMLKERFETSLTSSTSITQYRHRKHLENCLQSLEAFQNLGVDDVVLGAEELRHAASDLGRITGRVDVEEVLDVVFREFCIGK
ncbi:mitochondrial splicing system protein [Entomortierella chlamydospora]|uniref:Mitochondrial splicing system protein n=1 Tax=Entomortierella chlamydospora TaxID=101097 RepID=A0A9P6MX54_9FUNG|nr:mitochondrial splicing system protein [Entomortierella chlamydospora]